MAYAPAGRRCSLAAGRAEPVYRFVESRRPWSGWVPGTLEISAPVAQLEPLDDEPVELPVESVVDELLELGSVRLDRGGDAPLELDDGRAGHGRESTAMPLSPRPFVPQ
jgi:hypothetical protein